MTGAPRQSWAGGRQGARRVAPGRGRWNVDPMIWIIIIVVLVVLALGGFGFTRRGR
jgi:flagellar basal body-associated protein FliL